VTIYPQKQYRIYKIVNKINNDFYIGQTKQTLKRRWAGHKSCVKTGKTTHIYNAIRKYGIDNFVIFSIEECFPDEALLDLLEQEWIKLLNPKYNHTKGGHPGNTRGNMTPEAYAQYCINLSNSKKGDKNPNYKGKAVTEYQRQVLKEMNSKRTKEFYNKSTYTREQKCSSGQYDTYLFSLFNIQFCRFTNTAKRIGISPITLRRYLNGVCNNPRTILKIKTFVDNVILTKNSLDCITYTTSKPTQIIFTRSIRLASRFSLLLKDNNKGSTNNLVANSFVIQQRNHRFASNELSH
jgi:group I intron endonuclease